MSTSRPGRRGTTCYKNISTLLQKYFQVRPGGQPGPAEAVPVQPDLQQPDGRGPDPSQVSDQPSRSRVQKLSLGLQFYILNFTLHNIRYFVGGAEGLKGFFMT